MKTLISGLASAACALASTVAFALPYTETADGGDTIATAADTTSISLTQINGNLYRNPNGPGAYDIVDLYRIYILAPTLFSATTSGALSDPVLYLFNSAGQAVVMNDDDPSGTNDAQSAIGALDASALPGYYYLAIAFAGVEPVSSSLVSLFDVFGSQLPLTAQPLETFLGEPLASNLDIPGGYQISLVVPAPSVLGLMLFGLIGFAAQRKVRK